MSRRAWRAHSCCAGVSDESSSHDTKLAAAVIRELWEYIPDSASEHAARSCTTGEESLRKRSSRGGIASSDPTNDNALTAAARTSTCASARYELIVLVV